MRIKTPTFIVELPLIVKPDDERVMLARFEAGRQVYNATLDECLKRLDLMRESKQWQAARKIPRTDEFKKERIAAFNACFERFNYSEYSLSAVATNHKNKGGFKNRLGAHETQKIAKRVFMACERYRLRLFPPLAKGKKPPEDVNGHPGMGRPHFKKYYFPLQSLEGQSNEAGIRWNKGAGYVTWGKINLKAIVKDTEYLSEALESKTKYCRIVWKNIKGKKRWYVQLAQQGIAPKRYEFKNNGSIVGLDIGPSSIAIISDNNAGLEKFAPSVEQPWKHIKALQRAQDRSRRATNQENYNANGTVKNGRKTWKKSSRYKARQDRLAEIERKLSATRKSDHGNLCNRILAQGNVIQTETLSYKAFQKMFGKSVKVRAPGMFVSELKRKAESLGGCVNELHTCGLKMSQYDHITQECTKKPLSQRWHDLGGNSEIFVQRDIYSAFLAKHVIDTQHNPSVLAEEWTSAEKLLLRVGLCLNQPKSGIVSAVPTVRLPSDLVARESRYVKPSKSQNVVAEMRESGCTKPLILPIPVNEHSDRIPCL